MADVLTPLGLTLPDFDGPADIRVINANLSLLTELVGPVHNILAYGAVGTDVVDDAAAIQAAVTAAIASHGTVYIPPGTYRVASPITVPGSCMIQGAGVSVSLLMHDDDDADLFTVTGPAVAVRDLGFNSAVAGVDLVGGCCLNFIGVGPYLVDGVAIDTYYYGIALNNAGMGTAFVTNVAIANTRSRGIYVHGGGGIYLTNVRVGSGTGRGFYCDATAELVMQGMDVANCPEGGFAFIGAGGAQLTSIYCVNCLADSIADGRGWQFDGTTAQGGFIPDVVLLACWSSSSMGASGNGFEFTFANRVVMTACEALANDRYGIVLNAGCVDVLLQQCVVAFSSHLAPGVYDAVHVAGGVTDISIIGCRLGGGGGQNWGINIAAGAGDRFVIMGNNLTGNDSGAIFDGSTGVVKVKAHNLGFNPVGFLPAAVPASGADWVNDQGVEAMVFVSDGTVTAIALDTVPTGLVAGSFRVPPGGVLRLTYTVAPNFLTHFA